MDFESLKSSASNFDKITKALEASTEKPESSGNKSNILRNSASCVIYFISVLGCTFVVVVLVLGRGALGAVCPSLNVTDARSQSIRVDGISLMSVFFTTSYALPFLLLPGPTA